MTAERTDAEEALLDQVGSSTLLYKREGSYLDRFSPETVRGQIERIRRTYPDQKGHIDRLLTESRSRADRTPRTK